MQVQKGLVKYKDRSDILCTYGTTDDGRTYYFLDGEKLSNGYIVASTALVEAIDPLVVASSIGIVDINGSVIVPFENKSIKPVNDKFLLIESAKPVTSSVLDAIAMRKDPLAATKLVSTSATIKEKMYNKMGPRGKFLFNDQFSEVMLTDLNGKNLCDNKLFSFVGINDKTIFLSGNTVESEIFEYPLVIEEKEDVKINDNGLDVRDFKVEKKMIDDAMSEEMPKNDSADKVFGADSNINNYNSPVNPVVSTVDAPVENQNVNTGVVSDNFLEENTVLDKDDDIDGKEITPASFDKIVEENKFDDFVSSATNIDTTDVDDNNIFTKDSDKEEELSHDVVGKHENIFEDNSKDADNFNFADILNDRRPVEKKRDFSLDDDYDDNSRDTIFEDTALIMNKMISQIEEQRNIMADYEEKVKKLSDFRRKAFEENKRLVNKYENLFKEYKSMEDEVSKMQDMIDRQREEIKSLKLQVAGKNELVKLLGKAQSLLDDDYDRGYSKIKTM